MIGEHVSPNCVFCKMSKKCPMRTTPVNQMSNKCQKNAKQMSDRCFGYDLFRTRWAMRRRLGGNMSNTCQKHFRQMSKTCQKNVKQLSTKCQTNVGQTFWIRFVSHPLGSAATPGRKTQRRGWRKIVPNIPVPISRRGKKGKQKCWRQLRWKRKCKKKCRSTF